MARIMHTHRTVVTTRYNRLAGHYDRRWRRYLDCTLTEALDALRLTGHERLLDVGCGSGAFERLARRRFPELRMVGLDVSLQMIERARQQFQGDRKIAFCLASGEHLPWRERQFDAVLCANMLHDAQQPAALLAECVRSLTAGGQLVIVDWCRNFWHCRLAHYWWKLTDRAYVTMYRVEELSRLLVAAGVHVGGARRFIAPPYYGMMQLSGERGA